MDLRQDTSVMRAPLSIRPYGGESYYGLAPLKPAPWAWKVSTYLFVSGLAGAAQVIAAAADRAGGTQARPIVRDARIMAAAGGLVGAVLLVADLRTPQRWYNMLRIFRPTSPMSIGTYLLSSFGAATAFTTLAELFDGESRLGRLARAAGDRAQIPAALAGAGMTTYTAALLASTSTPAWAAAPRPLGVQFASSAVASGAAALSLAGRCRGDERNADSLDRLAMIASGLHVAATLAAESERRALGVGPEPSTSDRGRRLLDIAVAGAVPLACLATNRLSGGRLRQLSVVASLAILAGNYLARSSTLATGNRSAESPHDYFRLAQPQNLPECRLDGVSARRIRTAHPMR